MKLEDLQPDASVRGIAPDALVSVVNVTWHGSDALTLVYRMPDGRVADEVIAHFAGQVGAEVTVILKIEATLPVGASDHVVRTVTENSRTLRFTSHGFESE